MSDLLATGSGHEVLMSQRTPRVQHVCSRNVQTEDNEQVPDVQVANAAERELADIGGNREIGPDHGRVESGVRVPPVRLQRADRRPEHDQPRAVVPVQADRTV